MARSVRRARSTHISRRVARIIRMTIADMANLADRRPGAIRLENADTYLPPAPHVLQATRDAVGVDRYNSYLPLHGLPELRQAVAHRYATDWGLRYDPEDEIVVTSGAGEAMLVALLALVNPGDKVLLTNPTYSGMAQRVKVADGAQAFAELQEETGWHLDVAHLARVAKGCKVLFYASPCMPTGTVFTREETRALAEVAKANNAILLFNASLDRVVFDQHRVVHPATLHGLRDRTLTIGSMSKNYNMPGWPIGWVAGPHELIRAVENVHIFNGIMPSGIAQAGATAALTGPQAWVTESVATYQHHRDVLLDSLAPVPGLHAVRPEGGYFFLANLRALGVRSPAFCEALLAQQNVAVTPMVACGRDDFGYDRVRFIFTNEPEARLREAGARIRAFVRANYRT